MSRNHNVALLVVVVKWKQCVLSACTVASCYSSLVSLQNVLLLCLTLNELELHLHAYVTFSQEMWLWLQGGNRMITLLQHRVTITQGEMRKRGQRGELFLDRQSLKSANTGLTNQTKASQSSYVLTFMGDTNIFRAQMYKKKTLQVMFIQNR